MAEGNFDSYSHRNNIKRKNNFQNTEYVNKLANDKAENQNMVVIVMSIKNKVKNKAKNKIKKSLLKLLSLFYLLYLLLVFCFLQFVRL